MEKKPASSLVVLLGNALSGIDILVWSFLPHLGVIDRWPASLKRARYNALIAFSG